MKGALWQTMNEDNHRCQFQHCPMDTGFRDEIRDALSAIRETTGRMDERQESLYREVYGNGKTGLLEKVESHDTYINQQKGKGIAAKAVTTIIVSLIVSLIVGLAVNYYDNRDEAHLRQQQTVNK